MPNRFIYVLLGEKKDLSRWLLLFRKPSGELVIHITDLCQPGRISSLEQCMCPLEYFSSVTNGGAVQITTSTGYFLARPIDETLHIEFRGLDESAPNRVVVDLDEVRARLDLLRKEPVAS